MNDFIPSLWRRLSRADHSVSTHASLFGVDTPRSVHALLRHTKIKDKYRSIHVLTNRSPCVSTIDRATVDKGGISN